MSLGCRIRRNFERPSKELVEAFRGIPVANIDDNCGRIAAVDSSIYPLNLYRVSIIVPYTHLQ